MAAPTNRRRFKHFPKIKTAQHGEVIDKEKVKQQYLVNPFYTWKQFASLHNYNPSILTSNNFPFKSWQSEWLQKQTEEQDESLVEEAVNVRATVLKARLKFVPEWKENIQTLKALQKFMMTQAAQKARHDVENSEAIKRGEKTAKYDWTASDLKSFTEANKILFELESQALLVPANQMSKHMLPMPEKTSDDRAEEVAADEYRSSDIGIIGAQNIPSEKVTEMLASWYDQAATKQSEDILVESKEVFDGEEDQS